jgi:molecular chaperone GrpE
MENRENRYDLDENVQEQPPVDRPESGAFVQTEAAAGDQRSEVEQLKSELEAAQDRFIRQAAEFQNYKRRTEQEKLSLVDLGKITVLKPMLGIMDDLTRSIEASSALAEGGNNSNSACQSLKEGVELVHRKFSEELARLGVQPIEAIGKPFNEAEHEALMQQPAPEGTVVGTVLAEFEKGYRVGDRVLRHSKVVVAG